MHWSVCGGGEAEQRVLDHYFFSFVYFVHHFDYRQTFKEKTNFLFETFSGHKISQRLEVTLLNDLILNLWLLKGMNPIIVSSLLFLPLLVLLFADGDSEL